MHQANSITQIPESRLSKFLFADTRMGWFWLIVRAYVGWQWLEAGWTKLHSPAWIGDHAGTALQGFISGALQKTAGLHPDVQGWYGAFLQNFVSQHTVGFSYLVTYGEIAVGVALILGLFTGIASFFGSFMNMSYLLAGTVSVNPILFLLQLFLILAWRIAGWVGLDRFVLPALGTPWQKGHLITDQREVLQNMTAFNMKKAVGYGALLWLIITGIIGGVYGFGLYFHTTSSEWVRIIAALVAGGVALFFAREVEVSNLKEAWGYSLMWLIVPIILDLLIISWLSGEVFGSWEYWFGHILVFLSPWIILLLRRRKDHVL